MTKREAKRYVCGIIVASLDGDIGSGAAWITKDGTLGDEDEGRVLEAIRELQDEMQRRSGE